ncbi:MAG: amidase domain-containing protein [Bacillota bacterium]
MFVAVPLRRLLLVLAVAVGAAVAIRLAWHLQRPARATPDPRAEAQQVLQRLLDERAKSLLEFDDGPLASHYDLSSRLGKWAYEHEQRRLRYLRAWTEKRRINLVSARSEVRVTRLQVSKDEIWASLIQSARLGYIYRDDPTLEKHLFGIGTRHAIQLVRKDGRWVIRRDWYTDPLDEDELVPEVTPADVTASGGILEPFARLAASGAARCSPPGVDEPGVAEALPGTRVDGGSGPFGPVLWLLDLLGSIPRKLSELVSFTAGAASRSWRYNRQAAATYARTYCGGAWGCGNGGRYNPQYRDYTDIGGDCTNFASQVLHAGGLPMDSAWYYRKGSGGSRAWVQTGGLLDHLLGTGRARVLVRGKYADVVMPNDRFPKGAINELEPGDLIAYQEKGRVVHFGAVVGRDFRGYTVVNSHTADRNAVPWDVGWDQATIFWLLKVRD